jgi:hypothetical protein
MVVQLLTSCNALKVAPHSTEAFRGRRSQPEWRQAPPGTRGEGTLNVAATRRGHLCCDDAAARHAATLWQWSYVNCPHYPDCARHRTWKEGSACALAYSASSSARAGMSVSGTYLPPNLPKRPAASGRSVPVACAGVDAGASGAAVAATRSAATRLTREQTTRVPTRAGVTAAAPDRASELDVLAIAAAWRPGTRNPASCTLSSARKDQTLVSAWLRKGAL